MDGMVGDRAARRLGPASRICTDRFSIWRIAVHARPDHREQCQPTSRKGDPMVALIVLLLLLLLLGGFGFAAHVLWFILIAALVIWAIGFFVGGVADGGGRRGWYRW